MKNYYSRTCNKVDIIDLATSIKEDKEELKSLQQQMLNVEQRLQQSIKLLKESL